MGVDRALHVEVNSPDYEKLEPFHVAQLLSKIVEKEGINLVLLGKQVCAFCPLSECLLHTIVSLLGNR